MKLSMITCTGTGTIGGYTVTKETTMKQIDTAQLDITACQAQAAEYHARGFNCAQAVACTLAPAVGLDPQVAFTLTEGFGAGMGGMIELFGKTPFRLADGFGSGFGFDGVAIALIAQLNPIGALVVALLFGILSTGGTMMQSVIGVPTAIVDIIRGMIIIFAVAGMAMVKLPKVKALISSLGSKNKKAEVTA